MYDKSPLRGLAAMLLGDDDLKLAAWRNVPIDYRWPDGQTKIDAHGNMIKWADYGKFTQFGWQIDHYPTPKALGGLDVATNVRALHHSTNAALGGLLGQRFKR